MSSESDFGFGFMKSQAPNITLPPLFLLFFVGESFSFLKSLVDCVAESLLSLSLPSASKGDSYYSVLVKS